jgi:hypothetical protein
METNNVNEIEVTKGVIKGYSTKWNLFFKKDGTKHYIDEVIKDAKDTNIIALRTRNSNTGESNIRLISELNEGRFRNTFFFQN